LNIKIRSTVFEEDNTKPTVVCFMYSPVFEHQNEVTFNIFFWTVEPRCRCIDAKSNQRKTAFFGIRKASYIFQYDAFRGAVLVSDEELLGWVGWMDGSINRPLVGCLDDWIDGSSKRAVKNKNAHILGSRK
jgi:hypothetical protein